MLVLLALHLFTASIGESGNPALTLNEIRHTFRTAVDSETNARHLIIYTGSSTPLRLGYTGAATILMAKHTLNPMAKLNYFENGKALLELAIQREPGNMELRFLRYCIQSNIPALLAYHQNKDEDYRSICKSLSTIKDEGLRQMIVESKLFYPCQ
ncbi:MAG: hypothetical protein WC760_07965 [Bacteroidia bacterium]|jgi:hypothetical protein